MMTSAIGLTADLASLERLIRWIAPRTVGRDCVLERLAEVKTAAPDFGRLHQAVCRLSRALGQLYPHSAVISLAQRRVRDMALALAHR